MNTELHKFSTDNFTKRYADGNEVKKALKPSEYNKWKSGVQVYAPLSVEDNVFQEECQKYQAYYNSTPLIKLPTISEFIEALTSIEIPKYEKYDLIVMYQYFLNTLFNLSQFVPSKDGKVLAEPERYSEFHPLRLSSGDEFAKWHHECWEYQAAKDRVMFEGWEVYSNESSHVGIKRYNNDSIVFHDSGIITILDPAKKINLTQIKTISSAIILGLFIKPIK